MAQDQQSIFLQLIDPPVTSNCHYRSNYCSTNGNYVLVTIYRENRDPQHTIWFYDLDKQEISSILKPLSSQYMDAYNYTDYSMFSTAYDEENNSMYILTYNGLITVDIDKNKWNSIPSNRNHERFQFSNCHFIPSPINELHITCGYHFRYKESENEIVQFMNDTTLFQTSNSILGNAYSDTHQDEQANFVYRHATQQLFMIQSDTKYMLVCDISNGNVSDWTQYETELPRKPHLTTDSDFILGFDQIIFWFDYELEEVCCLDLDHNDKWHQCHNILPYFENEYGYTAEPIHIIQDKDNNVHLISFDKGSNHHFRASLFDILPLEIIKSNKEMQDLMVFGFIRRLETEYNLIYIPIYLKQLIVKFYSKFV